MRSISLAPARSALAWRVAAAAALALGFADLARGGVTVGPILLVVGYFVCIPLALLTW